MTTVNAIGWNIFLDAGEREDRQIHRGDDEDAEQARLDHLGGRRSRELEALVATEQSTQAMLRLAETAQAVLDDDHRAVDDQAEIERAQAHQIAGDLVLHHAADGHQHRQRNHCGRNQRRPQVAEQQEQDGDDQQGAFEQVFLHVAMVRSTRFVRS
jgi:hypothetical protein